MGLFSRATEEEKRARRQKRLNALLFSYDIDEVRQALEEGAEVNTYRERDTYHCAGTPLHWAALYGCGKIVELLLKNGADAKIRDDAMRTPAEVAEKENHRAIARLIRGEDLDAPAKKPEPAPVSDVWRLVAADEVAHISNKPSIGYRVTEIFNFSARRFTQMTRNLETGAETQVLREFDEFLDRAPLESAWKKLSELGGTAPQDSIHRKLDKPKLSVSGA